MKQLATITVIMSSHGTVTGVCCKATEPEVQKQSYELCSEISSHNTTTSEDVKNVFTNWYSKLKAVAGTIAVESGRLTRVANTSKVAVTFNAMLT